MLMLLLLVPLMVLVIFQETEGVAVATYGSSREFPAFFTPNSGFQAPYNLTNPTQAAHFIGMS
jgi:pseudouridine-5'-phosphate glycosidase/pseudouridine kinase